MNTCKKSGIKLPDIGEIDWKQAFEISSDSGNNELDPRLLSHCKDQIGNPLIISLYLSGYDKNCKILYKFIENNVPIHVFDSNGENIVFHMIRNMRGYKYQPLKLLFKLTKEEDHRMLLNTYNKAGHSPLFLALQKYIVHKEYEEKKKSKPYIICVDEYKEEIESDNGDDEKYHIEREPVMTFSWECDMVDAVECMNIAPETIINCIHIMTMKDLYRALDQIRKHFVLIICINQIIKYCKPYEADKYIKERKSKFKWDLNVTDMKQCDEKHFIHVVSLALDTLSTEIGSNKKLKMDINVDMKQIVVKLQYLNMNGNRFTALSQQQFVNQMCSELDINENKRQFYAILYEYIHQIKIEKVPNRLIDLFIEEYGQKVIGIADCVASFKKNRDGVALKSSLQLVADNNGIADFGPLKGKFFEKYYDILSRRFLRIDVAQREFKETFESDIEKYIQYFVNKNALKINIATKDEIPVDVPSAISIKKELYHLLLLNHADVNFPCHSDSFSCRLSPLAYILTHHFEQIDILKNIVFHGANLLFDEMKHVPQWMAKATLQHNYQEYLSLFDHILKTNNVPYNNPLNCIMLNQNGDFDTVSEKIQSLQIICEWYPHFIDKKSEDRLYPIQLAIKQRDFDAMLAIYRYTPSTNMDKIIYFNKYSVKSMIKWFVEELLVMNKNKSNIIKVTMLLHCFDFKDILKWEYDNIFNKKLLYRDHWESVSLINYCKDKELWNILRPLQELKVFIKQLDEQQKAAFDAMLLQSQGHAYDSALVTTYNTRNVSNNINLDELFANSEQQDDAEASDYKQIPHDDKSVLYHDDEISKVQGESSIWIEIFYSTLVETFSTADLYTDIIIMRDLYLTEQQWWTSWMIFLVICPYLVSYSALTSLIDNAIFQYKLQSITNIQQEDKCTKTKNSCANILILFMMTPLCILYLIIIDMTFMVYVLLSTLLLLITCGKADIRHLIDDYIFRKLFKMNKTQIVGYRRLRTLSQLLFETVPQILLQLRILIEIKLNDDVDYYIDEMTIVWSIVFAVLHFLLEYTIITLDAKALRMSFIHYAFICLGARLNWIPYGHLLDERCTNVESIENSIDLTKPIYIASPTSTAIDTEYSVSSNIFNYDKIDAGLFGFQYKIEYEFSEESITRLAEYLTYLPIPSLPAEFNSVITSPILYSLFNDVLLTPHQVEIKLGGAVCKNVDLFNLLELYRSSIHKVNLNMDTVDTVTIIGNTKGSDCFKEEYRQHILNEFVYYCNLKLLDCLHEIDPQSSGNLKDEILKRALSDITIEQEFAHSYKKKSSFNILRKCYNNGVLFGLECEMMAKVYHYVEACLIRSQNEDYYIYVAMLILFYSQKTIHHHCCSFGCCKLNEKIKNKQLLKVFDVYLPQTVKIENLTVSLELLQCFDIFESNFEELLLNMCKADAPLSNEPPQTISTTFNDVYSRTMIPIVTQNSMDQLDHLLFTKGKQINIECKWTNYFNESNDIEIQRMDMDAFICFVNDAMNHDNNFSQINKDEVLCYLRHITMNGAMFLSLKKTEFNKQLNQECNVRKLYDTISNHTVGVIRDAHNYKLTIDDIYSFKWIKVDHIKNCTKKQLTYIISLTLDRLIQKHEIKDPVKHIILLYLQSQYIDGARFMSMTAEQLLTFIKKSGISNKYLRILLEDDFYSEILCLKIETLSQDRGCFLPNSKMSADSHLFKWSNVNSIAQCTNKEFIYIVSLQLDELIRTNVISNRSVKPQIAFYLQQKRMDGSQFIKMKEILFTESVIHGVANNALIELGYLDTMKLLYSLIYNFNFETISEGDDCLFVSYMTHVNENSIGKLDSIVYALKMSHKYQSYLHNTQPYRKSSLKVIGNLYHELVDCKRKSDIDDTVTYCLPINDVLRVELFDESEHIAQDESKMLRINSYLQIFNIKLDLKRQDAADVGGNIEIYFMYSNGQNIEWNKATLYKAPLNYKENHFHINIQNNYALAIYNKMLFGVKKMDDICPVYIDISGDSNNRFSHDLNITVGNLQISDTMMQSVYKDEVVFGGGQLQYGNDITVILSDSLNTELLALSQSFEILEIGFRFYLIPDDSIRNKTMKYTGHIGVSLYEIDKQRECRVNYANYIGTFTLDITSTFNVVLDENIDTLNEYLCKNKTLSNVRMEISLEQECQLAIGYDMLIKHSNRRNGDNTYRTQSVCIHHNEISFQAEEMEYKDEVTVAPDILFEFTQVYEISRIVFNFCLVYKAQDHVSDMHDDVVSGNIKLSLNNNETYNSPFTLHKRALGDKCSIIIEENIKALDDCIYENRELPALFLEISVDSQCLIGCDIFLKGSNYRTVDDDENHTETTKLNADTQQPPTKHKHKTFYQYLCQFCQHPLSNLPLLYFLMGIAMIIVNVFSYITSNDVGFIIAGIWGSLLCFYGLKHFHTLLFHLKYATDAFYNRNQQFKTECTHLNREVTRLSSALQHLQEVHVRLQMANAKNKENLETFRQVLANMAAFGHESIAELANIHEKSAKIQRKWHDSLYQHERELLHTVFGRMERTGSRRGINVDEFKEFSNQLPASYRTRFDRLGTFQHLSKGGSLIQYEDLEVALDLFAEMKVDDVDIEFEIKKTSRKPASKGRTQLSTLVEADEDASVLYDRSIVITKSAIRREHDD